VLPSEISYLAGRPLVTGTKGCVSPESARPRTPSSWSLRSRHELPDQTNEAGCPRLPSHYRAVHAAPLDPLHRLCNIPSPCECLFLVTPTFQLFRLLAHLSEIPAISHDHLSRSIFVVCRANHLDRIHNPLRRYVRLQRFASFLLSLCLPSPSPAHATQSTTVMSGSLPPGTYATTALPWSPMTPSMSGISSSSSPALSSSSSSSAYTRHCSSSCEDQIRSSCRPSSCRARWTARRLVPVGEGVAWRTGAEVSGGGRTKLPRR
jgi:hypothetical protein